MTPAVALITCPPDLGLPLARLMVEARLAACVQVEGPLTSVYPWEGSVQEDQEVRLVAKTSLENLPALREFLRLHHPYQVPQLVMLPAQGSEDYLGWWKENLRP